MAMGSLRTREDVLIIVKQKATLKLYTLLGKKIMYFAHKSVGQKLRQGAKLICAK